MMGDSMVRYPEYHLRAEIRRILRTAPGATEVLLRVRGRHYDPDRPETFLHVRALDPRDRARKIGIGNVVPALLVLTARFVEEAEGAHRTHGIDGRPRRETEPGPIRVLGHDSRVSGRVLAVLDVETLALDAGIPLLVRVPAPTGLPRAGDHVEFLLQEPVLVEFF